MTDSPSADTAEVTIDPDLCAGLGECLAVAPDIVVLASDGIARVTSAVGDRSRLEALAASCPMAAIAVRRIDVGRAA